MIHVLNFSPLWEAIISKITAMFRLHHHKPSVNEFRSHFDNNESVLVRQYEIRLTTIDTCFYQTLMIHRLFVTSMPLAAQNIARAWKRIRNNFLSSFNFNQSSHIIECTVSRWKPLLLQIQFPWQTFIEDGKTCYRL